MIFTPSVACANPLHYARDIDELISAGITVLHYDIMDGRMVKNFALSPDILKEMKTAYPAVTFDVHAMVMEPLDYVQTLADSGASWLTFHQKAGRIAETIDAIHAAGMKAGLALNPDEAPESLYPYLPRLDLVLVMGIQPGFPGRPMAEGTTERIATLASLRKSERYAYRIIIDGGADNSSAAALQRAGVDIMVLGYRSLFRQPVSIADALALTRSSLQ